MMSVCYYVLNWVRNYEDDKILIKNLFELKGYNANHLVSEFSRKS